MNTWPREVCPKDRELQENQPRWDKLASNSLVRLGQIRICPAACHQLVNKIQGSCHLLRSLTHYSGAEPLQIFRSKREYRNLPPKKVFNRLQHDIRGNIKPSEHDIQPKQRLFFKKQRSGIYRAEGVSSVQRVWLGQCTPVWAQAAEPNKTKTRRAE